MIINMSEDATPDEKPKRTVARKVVAEKRLYFVPTHDGEAIEATDVDDAVSKAKKRSKKLKKEGDE